ncbi:MAG: serine hydroxymethyltransferase [Candidatus Wallbacteria bacterium]|nr:serine hydroxymethyltransferase [Candidatus Wallbacteria bacterium]MBI4868164.1 serine hydroxymethyltransferase [Candidatus Wallbacteria bacterium]
MQGPSLRDVDPAIADLIDKEERRQVENIELIASENIVSRAVLEAMGSVLTNKYAEGYPAKRYYGGCEVVDQVESLAIERARKLFGAEHANVQPHSGSQANLVMYDALLQPGDTVLGMNLSMGGHLTHGSPVNFSGKRYRIIPYGVGRETETVDYDEVERLAHQEKPKMVLAGWSAYPRILDFPRFRAIADSVGALFVVDMAHFAGLVAAGLHPNPCETADVVTTTTHKTLRGPRGGMILCREKYKEAIDKALFPGDQGGPLMHVIAGKAVALAEAATEDFRAYQRQILANSRALVGELAKRGFRAVSGGTDTHLGLMDVSGLGVSGSKAEKALDVAAITVNKNMIPFDTRKPFVTSGIRVGTPAVTTRGMKEEHMAHIAGWMAEAVAAREDENALGAVRGKVVNFTREFPLHVPVDMRRSGSL